MRNTAVTASISGSMPYQVLQVKYLKGHKQKMQTKKRFFFVKHFLKGQQVLPAVQGLQEL